MRHHTSISELKRSFMESVPESRPSEWDKRLSTNSPFRTASINGQLQPAVSPMSSVQCSSCLLCFTHVNYTKLPVKAFPRQACWRVESNRAVKSVHTYRLAHAGSLTHSRVPGMQGHNTDTANVFVDWWWFSLPWQVRMSALKQPLCTYWCSDSNAGKNRCLKASTLTKNVSIRSFFSLRFHINVKNNEHKLISLQNSHCVFLRL